MNIEGIPVSVDWKVIRDFVLSLGIDANQISRSEPFVIDGDSLTCGVFALDEEGNRYVTGNRKVAMHRICIKIDRPEC